MAIPGFCHPFFAISNFGHLFLAIPILAIFGFGHLKFWPSRAFAILGFGHVFPGHPLSWPSLF
jgi:hypothetical protein